MAKTYTCPKHNIEGLTSFCPSCVTEFKERKPATEMTRAERVAAMRTFPEVLTFLFDNLHQWVEELMGRPVWTHEMGTRGWTQLIEELESGQPAGVDDVLGKLPQDKPVLLVEIEP